MRPLKKPALKTVHQINDRERPYKFLGVELQMPDHDFDIRLVRPDGTSLLVQWRIENETVDVCLCKDKDNPDTKAVYVTMADLGKAKQRKDGSQVGQQITIM